MTDFVTTNREYGEFLVRFSSDYTKTDVKNANTFTILAPRRNDRIFEKSWQRCSGRNKFY